jgi:hypothetical protein
LVAVTVVKVGEADVENVVPVKSKFVPAEYVTISLVVATRVPFEYMLPAQMLPPTPTPPDTTRAPLEALLEAVVFVTDTTPDEVKPVSVPIDVIFGCEAVVMVPVSVVAETVVAVT